MPSIIQNKVKTMLREELYAILSELGEIVSLDSQGDIQIILPSGETKLISPAGLASSINRLYRPLSHD